MTFLKKLYRIDRIYRVIQNIKYITNSFAEIGILLMNTLNLLNIISFLSLTTVDEIVKLMGEKEEIKWQ